MKEADDLWDGEEENEFHVPLMLMFKLVKKPRSVGKGYWANAFDKFGLNAPGEGTTMEDAIADCLRNNDITHNRGGMYFPGDDGYPGGETPESVARKMLAEARGGDRTTEKCDALPEDPTLPTLE